MGVNMVNYKLLAAIFTISALFCNIQVSCSSYHENRNITQNKRNLSLVLDFKHTDTDKAFSVSSIALADLILSGSSYILTNLNSWNSMKKFLKANESDYERFLSKFDIYKKDDFLLVMPQIYSSGVFQDFNMSGFEHVSPCDIPDLCMEDIEIFKRKMAYYNFPYMLSVKSQKLIELLKAMFIPDVKRIEWNVYMVGHGLAAYQIAGITQYTFKELLSLLSHRLNTKAFCFMSCFAAGNMSTEVFGKDKYRFPVFCIGVTDVPLVIRNCFDYAKFFDKMNSPGNSQEFIKLFMKMTDNTIANTVSVRYPGLSCFVIPNIPEKVFVINKNTLTRELNDLCNYENIIIDTPVILPALNLQGKSQDLPDFITASKGTYANYLAKINAPHVTYSHLFRRFCTIRLNNDVTGLKKTILIGKINCLDDNYKPITIRNILMVFSADENQIFFQKKGKGYSMDITFGTQGECAPPMFTCYFSKRKLDRGLTREYVNKFKVTRFLIKHDKQSETDSINKILFPEKGISELRLA